MIDFSKRWQQVHIRALISAYNRSPYFQFFSDNIEKILLSNHRFLFDLNAELLNACLEILKFNKCILYTDSFEPVSGKENDYRYSLSPGVVPDHPEKPYFQVFNNNGFIPDLSILDLIFNMGPESSDYL
jgi:hypothetical protein